MLQLDHQLCHDTLTFKTFQAFVVHLSIFLSSPESSLDTSQMVAGQVSVNNYVCLSQTLASPGCHGVLLWNGNVALLLFVFCYIYIFKLSLI